MRFDTKKYQKPMTAQNLTQDTGESVGDLEKVTITVSQPERIAQIKKLVEEHPEECEVIEVNKTAGKDESIRVRIPMAWIEIDPEETDK